MKSEYHFKFEELIVYQKAIEFGEIVHSQVSTFPKIEDYWLSAQFAHAADSIHSTLLRVLATPTQVF